LVAGATLPAATAAAREELGEEAESADWFGSWWGGSGTLGWGVSSCGLDQGWFEGVAVGRALVKLWLLQGGVALHSEVGSTGLSTSMGEAAVVGW